MKAFGYICIGVVGTLVALTAVGYAIGRADRKKAEAADKPASEAKPEPDPAAAETNKKEDNVVPFDDAAQPRADMANHQGADAAAAPISTSASKSKEQLVKMKIANNDPIVGSVEQYYLALVKAIHEKKIQGEIWRGEGDLPDAEVIELRGRTIDLMTALRTPRIYFETQRSGITLAYQYTTRKNPLMFVQVDEYIYVLGGDDSRFLSSVPDPEGLSCDPNGYLNAVLSCLVEKLGLE